MPDDVPIKSVDAIRQYIETKKMIERIKSGNIQPMDASLESLERALKDLQQAIEDLKTKATRQIRTLPTCATRPVERACACHHSLISLQESAAGDRANCGGV